LELRIVHEINAAYEFLKSKIRYDYIYQFSNLEVSNWKNVVCFGLYDENELKEIVMLNINYDIPVLLGASFSNESYNIELMKRIKGLLPTKFYTHMDRITLETVFSQDNILDLEEYVNMGLCDYGQLSKVKNSEVERLTFKNIEEIKALISESYPEAWLDDELVKLDENFGIYKEGKLISFAGIHGYSELYQVAAVAHVTTLPEFRRKGYGEKVVAALANSLNRKIKYIGLNVKADNIKAINCYKKLGFQEFGSFVACEIEISCNK
jgi:ribosomal protein S18 acetylase RimI-like enzyme